METKSIINKTFYLTIILISFSFIAKGQDNVFKKNTETKFEIVLGSKKTKNGFSLPYYQIRLLKINDSIKLKDLNIKKTLELLEDKEYDWYVNLLLYEITRRDAVYYFGLNVMSREIWINDFYDSDIKYWKQNLAKIVNNSQPDNVVN